ncbi:MAG: DUF1517 domain-containing protein [Okeania sp. SIO3H1]|uniref:DUF1517 domain-containing protein n=1 Tax=Okeania sp. SIO1I7 TaxID=2607772 RepID=UPI0013CAD1A8|nr:DUF1517 domain-containing protein [Okeania sp. SIO1I7]NEN88380.1 DUF1517 domain-containing protein [Okeania sp. SIO3H1]NET24146.1 DUF1517 domain-containing protein [Okeania sp. SIO1I7]
MRKSKLILATIVSLFLVNEVSINPDSNDISTLINTETSIAYAGRRGGGGRSRSRSSSGSSSRSRSSSPSRSKPVRSQSQPRNSKPKPTINNIVKPTNNTRPTTKPVPTSGTNSQRSGSFSQPSNNTKPNNNTRPTTNNINTGGRTRSGSFAPTTKKRYSVEPATGRRYYTRPGTQERYYQEAGTGRFYYVQPATQRRYYMNVDNGERYFIDSSTRRYYYEQPGTNRFYYVHPTTRVRYYYQPTVHERVVYSYYDGPGTVLEMYLTILLIGILLVCIFYVLIMAIAPAFGYSREVLVAEEDEYIEVIEESPGYVEVIEETLPVATVPEDLINDIVTVSKLQVAMVAPANNIQSNLAKMSEEIDIDTPEGRVQLLLRSAIALLQTEEYWTDVVASSETVESRQEAERIFEQLSFAERCKFEVNTVDDNVQLDRHIIVTLLLGTEDDYPLFSEVNDRESLKQILKELGKVTPDYLLVFELLWSPAKESDRLISI